MDKSFRLENWSIVSDNPNPYTPPEAVAHYLRGAVYGNPKFEDGSFVTTSLVIGSTGRLCQTKGGHTYELGQVDLHYLDYLKSINRPLDETNPVKVISINDDSKYKGP